MKKVYLIAVIVAIIAGVATYMFATEINSKTKFKDAEMVTVLVPAADIEKNVEITADMFEEIIGRAIILKLLQRKFLPQTQQIITLRLKQSLLTTQRTFI